MININPRFSGSEIPEHKAFTQEDAIRLEILKIESNVEKIKNQIMELDLELRHLELSHQEKEYDASTFNLVKQYTDIKNRLRLQQLEAENKLRELKESIE